MLKENSVLMKPQASKKELAKDLECPMGVA
jgi:hypothetical protein